MLSLSFSLAPARVRPALAATGKTIIYNLYATDGWQTLADGTTLYTYGFVGGRQGVPFTFAKSSKDGKPAGNITMPNGAPAPTPGAMTTEEAKMAGNAQFPAPVIYAAIGDVVEIRKNLGVTNPDAPMFLPDGKNILFSAPSPPQSSVIPWLDWLFGARSASAHTLSSEWWSVSVSGGAITQLTHIQTPGLYASISPDNRTIVSFSTNRIFVMNPDGTDLTMLISDTGGNMGTVNWIP